LTERDVVSARRRAHSRTFPRDAPPPERTDWHPSFPRRASPGPDVEADPYPR
jgi:hypothetical protein